MRHWHYTLDEHHRLVPVDVITWAIWFEKSFAQRVVAATDIGPLRVSTVFIGLDYRAIGNGPPIVYETLVFGPEEDMEIFGRVREIRPDLDGRRYCTWDEAERGHKIFVEIARQMVAEIDSNVASSLAKSEPKE